jgi:hypothetical protein
VAFDFDMLSYYTSSDKFRIWCHKAFEEIQAARMLTVGGRQETATIVVYGIE